MNKNLITILVLAVIAAGVFFWFKYSPKQEIANDQNVQNVSQGPAVKSANHSTLGKYLTDGNGLTLYIPLGPCWGSCLENWVPYLASSSPIDRASEDPLLNKLNRYPLRDGGYQYGYDERLLYWYRGDKFVGDTNGNNIEDGQWTVIKLP